MPVLFRAFIMLSEGSLSVYADIGQIVQLAEDAHLCSIHAGSVYKWKSSSILQVYKNRESLYRRETESLYVYALTSSRARAREKFCLSAICHIHSVSPLYINGLTAKIVWQIFQALHLLTQKWAIFVLNRFISPSFWGVFLHFLADLWQIIVVFSSKKHLFCCNNHSQSLSYHRSLKVYNRCGTVVA